MIVLRSYPAFATEQLTASNVDNAIDTTIQVGPRRSLMSFRCLQADSVAARRYALTSARVSVDTARSDAQISQICRPHSRCGPHQCRPRRATEKRASPQL